MTVAGDGGVIKRNPDAVFDVAHGFDGLTNAGIVAIAKHRNPVPHFIRNGPSVFQHGKSIRNGSECCREKWSGRVGFNKETVVSFAQRLRELMARTWDLIPRCPRENDEIVSAVRLLGHHFKLERIIKMSCATSKNGAISIGWCLAIMRILSGRYTRDCRLNRSPISCLKEDFLSVEPEEVIR